MLLETPDKMLVQANKPEELIGVGVKFERIRRITGYLVGTIDRFNNAKRKELADRVKHVTVAQPNL